MLFVGVLLVVVSVVGAMSGDTDEAVAALFSGVLGPVLLLGAWLTFSHLRLIIEAGEVVVHYGRSPITSRYRLDQIRDAEATDVTFWRYGGFGYRGSRRMLKWAGIIVRTGEAVVIHLTDGSKVIVTVDEAERAAAAIRVARGG